MWVEALRAEFDGRDIRGGWVPGLRFIREDDEAEGIPTHGMTPATFAEAVPDFSAHSDRLLMVELAGMADREETIASWLRLDDSTNSPLLIEAGVGYCLTPEPEPVLSWTMHREVREGRYSEGGSVQARRVRFMTVMRSPADGIVLVVRPCRVLVSPKLMLLVWERLECFPLFPEDLHFVHMRPPVEESDEGGPTAAQREEWSGWWSVHDSSLRGELPVLNRGSYPTTADAAERVVLRAAASQLESLVRLGQELETAEFLLLGGDEEDASTFGLADVQGELLGHIRHAAQIRRAIREIREPLPGLEPVRWFVGATERGPHIASTVAESYTLAREIAEDARDALATRASLATSAQLELARAAELRTGRLQRSITIVGAVVLGPSLVAATFGANVPLPGGPGWSSTALMALLMVVAAGVSYRWLSTLEPPDAKSEPAPRTATIPAAQAYLSPTRARHPPEDDDSPEPGSRDEQ